MSKKGDIRQVTHLQYTCWPSHANPSNPLPLLTFIRTSLRHADISDADAPMIVHTNLNNSRAGIFITIASTLKQLKVSGEINIPSFLKQAPSKGQDLLRSAKDFIYIHDVLVEAIVAGETNIKNSYLSRYINSLQCCQYSPLGNKYHIERQYELLNIDFIKKESSFAPKHEDMVWLPGYLSHQHLVLASYPHPDQTQQFWRLMLEHNVHTIVVLKSDPSSSFPDLTSDGPSVGPVNVTHRDDEISYDFKSKNFILEFGMSMRKFVKVIYADNFMSDFENIEDNLTLLETVHTRQNSLNKSAPIFVLDTAVSGSAGAAFCALMTVLQQLEIEQHCDVYQAVKTINMMRQGVWSSPDNLLQIYKIAEMLTNKGTGYQEKNNNILNYKRSSQLKLNICNWTNKTKSSNTFKENTVITDGWF